MSSTNLFRHQAYHSERPTSPYRLVAEPASATPGSDEYFRRITEATKSFHERNVAAVFLVHGTFAGDDSFGLLTELERHVPRLAKHLQRTRKGVFDLFAQETGNYTRRFEREIERAVNQQRNSKRTIPIRRFSWSGLNNHIARADGAVRLLVELAKHAEENPAALDHPLPPRVQVWGHSHGGNVMALIANLLAADEDMRQEFFTHSRRFCQSWLSRKINLQSWHEAQKVLRNDKHPLRRLQIDYVTFGTPLRYAWPEEANDRLVSFVNHRPKVTPLKQPGCDHLGPQKFRPWQLITGAAGDYVQQIGIAGSNIPAFPSVRAMLADWSLGRYLEAELKREFLLSRIHHGRRVAESGTTLLIDYHDQGLAPWRHILGHGTYTRRRWLPFHCEEVSRTLYS
ncbi:MAG: hypothetical protein RH917_05120 [Lacipirellulaceae bacterium]